MMSGYSEEVAAGIDIGGTAIKSGLVDSGGRILARRRLPYAGFASFEDIVAGLANAIVEMEALTSLRSAAIGIAAPGHARPSDGVMIDGTANVPLLNNRSLAAALRDRLARPCASLNDGSAAALGEFVFGAGKGLSRFALLTLGTGVGGGVVIDGRLVCGEGGIPPELGAIVLDDAPPPARTLEDFASAAGFAAAHERAGGPAGQAPEAIFEAASRGDAVARTAVDRTGRRIAQAFGMLINALNLEACLVGGGIGAAGEPLLAAVRGHLPDFTWPNLRARTQVLSAGSGEDAGVLGAASIALVNRRG